MAANNTRVRVIYSLAFRQKKIHYNKKCKKIVNFGLWIIDIFLHSQTTQKHCTSDTFMYSYLNIAMN